LKKKAFASTIFAGLAILVISLSAAIILSIQESELNAKKLFQAKQTAWLFADAKNVLENAFVDAETDGVYAAYGCEITAPDFCNTIKNNASTYLQDTLADLNELTQFTSVSNETSLQLECQIIQQTTEGTGGSEQQNPETPPAPQPPGEGESAPTTNVEYKNFSINISFTLKTNSSNSAKVELVKYEHEIGFFKTTPEEGENPNFGIHVKNNVGKTLANVRGTCTVGFTNPPATPTPVATRTPSLETTPTTTAIPQGSPYAFTPTPTLPTASKQPEVTPKLASTPLKPVLEQKREQVVETKTTTPDYLLFLLVLVFLIFLAAYYYKKKRRPQPSSLYYLIKQRKRF